MAERSEAAILLCYLLSSGCSNTQPSAGNCDPCSGGILPGWGILWRSLARPHQQPCELLRHFMPQAADCICLDRGTMLFSTSTKHKACAKQPISGSDMADHLHILPKILLLTRPIFCRVPITRCTLVVRAGRVGHQVTPCILVLAPSDQGTLSQSQGSRRPLRLRWHMPGLATRSLPGAKMC